MTNIAAKIIFFLLNLLARLPLGVLYIFADAIYLILYYIVRYRRAVVDGNLRQCYPEASADWRRHTAHRFYRNFADYIVETIKTLHISDEEIRRRFIFDGLDIITDQLQAGRSVVVYFAHTFNWEWAPSVTLHLPPTTDDGTPVTFGQVYRPLRAAAANSIMLRLRSRFGSASFAKAHVLRHLIDLRRRRVLTVTGFMSDQKPSHGDPTLVLEFLRRPTAMITGTETLARKLGTAAVYWDMHKLSRGHYRIVTRLIAADAADTEAGTLTRTYARMLQTTIDRRPDLWLWTHKRWKIPVQLPQQQ